MNGGAITISPLGPFSNDFSISGTIPSCLHFYLASVKWLTEEAWPCSTSMKVIARRGVGSVCGMRADSLTRSPLHCAQLQKESAHLSRASATECRACRSELWAGPDSATCPGFHMQNFPTKVNLMTVAGCGRSPAGEGNVKKVFLIWLACELPWTLHSEGQCNTLFTLKTM